MIVPILLYIVMFVFGILGAAILIKPDRIMARYYTAEETAAMTESPVWPTFVSVGRYLGFAIFVIIAVIMFAINDGENEYAATVALGMSVPSFLHNVFRITLEAELSPKTWSTPANTAAKMNAAVS